MIIEISGLLVALASLATSFYLGLSSVRLARKAISDAQVVAARATDDWRQQKWFDIYLESSTAYDLLGRFQALARTMGGPPLSQLQTALDDVTRQFRRVNALAVVFPRCAEIDQLVDATSGIKGEADARQPERLKRIFDASENLRTHALLSGDILKRSN